MSIRFFNTMNLSENYSSVFQNIGRFALYPYVKACEYIIEKTFKELTLDFFWATKNDLNVNPFMAFLIACMLAPFTIVVYLTLLLIVPVFFCALLTVIPILPILTAFTLAIATVGALLTAASALIMYSIALTADILGVEIASDDHHCNKMPLTNDEYQHAHCY